MSKLTDTLATMPRAASTEEDERAAEKLRQDQHNYVENAIATLKQQKGKLSYDEEAFARMDAFRAWVNENIHVEPTFRSLKNAFSDINYCIYYMFFRSFKRRINTTREWHFVKAHSIDRAEHV